MGNLFEKELSAEEIADKRLEIPYKDLRIRCKCEEFKLKFPFYRMEIKAYEYRLNRIQTKNYGKRENERWNTRTVETDVMTVA